MKGNTIESKGNYLLACGTVISLTNIDQSTTYGGMLEGYPNSEMNAAIIARCMQRAEKKYGQKPYLIAPIEKPNSREMPAGKRPWIELPRISCTADFFSQSFGEFGSSLTVCWYQDDFAFPIASSVLEELHRLVWREHARPHDDF